MVEIENGGRERIEWLKMEEEREANAETEEEREATNWIPRAVGHMRKCFMVEIGNGGRERNEWLKMEEEREANAETEEEREATDWIPRAGEEEKEVEHATDEKQERNEWLKMEEEREANAETEEEREATDWIPRTVEHMRVAIPMPQSYFCYQCNRTVALTPSPNSDLSCPNCSGGFLEESHSIPPLNPNHAFASSPTVFPDPFSLFADSLFPPNSPVVFSSTTIDLENPRNFSPFLFPTAAATNSSPSAFNPFDFLQNYLQNLRDRGSSVQFVVENHPGDPNFRLPPNFGDYFLGPGLEQLIQQLAENDPNRYGTPPASKQAIDGLPNVVITADVVNSDSNSCAVCMNDFEVGLNAKQMPCKHLYHSDCLIPWLQLHNSCPVCRYELPTEDPDYNNRRENSGQGQSSRSGGGGGAGGIGAQVDGGVSGSNSGGDGRRFRISLPWPFTVFGGNNDGNNSSSSYGGQQGGSGGGGSHGFEPRQESLD
ncbi:E3 ubiquitin-protein ligase RING1 [Bienertia sinuspersici]